MLAPLALGVVWLGGVWLIAMVALAASGMGWEWTRLSGGAAQGRVGVLAALIITVLLAGIVAVGSGADALALGIALLGGVAVWGVAAALGARKPIWTGAGTIWIALPCIALLWIDEGAQGAILLFWLFAVVWASDIGAYVFGRSLGGPRLAPRYSPNKTWSGAVGGLICSGLAGLAAAYLAGAHPGFIVAASVLLSVVAQIGDLAESLAKRTFGVKDSGGIIPGHGGLLDRLDSLLTAAPALALLMGAIGGSPLEWHP